jgi:hypothetical protein
MTVARLDAIGFCAHYSRQGDWAFEFALDLARRSSLQLNIFHFLADPYDATDRTGQDMPAAERARLIIGLEKEMRLYYDSRLGEYLDVGFRLCEDREWKELHKCLTKNEFQVLVLARPSRGATFGGKPIEEFAGSFVCPVVLVGPYSSRELRLNRPAALMADRLGLRGGASRGAAGPRFQIAEPAGIPAG